MRLFVIASTMALLTVSLSGCVAYEVASTAASVTGTVVGAAVDVTGAVVAVPFGGDDADDKKTKN